MKLNRAMIQHHMHKYMTMPKQINIIKEVES